MAHITQAQKKNISSLLKEIKELKNWSYSLSINNHSEIIMKVKSAPVKIPEGETYFQVNPYYVHEYNNELLNKIISILNTDNYNRSRIEIDYHDVGHYIRLTFGTWDKPFNSTGQEIDLSRSKRWTYLN